MRTRNDDGLLDGIDVDPLCEPAPWRLAATIAAFLVLLGVLVGIFAIAIRT
jgi:hypothetical protein